MLVKKPRFKKKSLKDTKRIVHFKTLFGDQKGTNIFNYGTNFLNKFKPSLYKGKNTFLIDIRKSFYESPLSISLVFNRKIKNKLFEDIAFETRLKFEKKTIIITAFQGKRESLEAIKEFEKIVRMPIANYIILEIESQAKKMGYKKIKINNPKNLESYSYPHVDDSLRYRGKTLLKKHREGILNETEKKELQKYREIEKKRIQKRIKKMYFEVAKKLGYKYDGKYYTKTF